jgi:hypothetical protein
MAIPCPRTSAITRSAAASRPCTPVSRRGSPATRANRARKNLPALLIEALDEPVTATIDGERREITKREGSSRPDFSPEFLDSSCQLFSRLESMAATPLPKASALRRSSAFDRLPIGRSVRFDLI